MSRKKEYAEAVIRELEVLMPEKKFEVEEITKNNSVVKTDISIITPAILLPRQYASTICMTGGCRLQTQQDSSRMLWPK